MIKERLRHNSNRIEGLISSGITGLAGLTIYAPDHKLAAINYPAPIAGHMFDIFGAMWAMQMHKLLTNKDDFVGQSIVAFLSALGLETLQYFNLSFGTASFVGDGLASPAVGVALSTTIPFASRYLDKIHRLPMVQEIYHRLHITHQPTRPFLGPDFPYAK